jgi:hemerythrin superfamily protein
MDALSLLKQDHQQVAALFEQFEAARGEEKILLAGQICQLLVIHARIEEELFYPAARGVLSIDNDDLVNEATVEHTSIGTLVADIAATGLPDDLFNAKVTVLGEYVAHHVKEEESELFPLLENTEIDFDALGEALSARKSELMTQLGVSADDAVERAGAAYDVAGLSFVRRTFR